MGIDLRNKVPGFVEDIPLRLNLARMGLKMRSMVGADILSKALDIFGSRCPNYS